MTVIRAWLLDYRPLDRGAADAASAAAEVTWTGYAGDIRMSCRAAALVDHETERA